MSRDTKTVAGTHGTYELTQLGAIEGLDLYHDIVRAVGPAIRGKLGNLGSLVGGDGEETKYNVAALIIEIMESIPRELMRDMRVQFSRATKVKSEGGLMLEMNDSVFDVHFAGRYSALTEWILLSLKHNFSDFLPSGGGAST